MELVNIYQFFQNIARHQVTHTSSVNFLDIVLNGILQISENQNPHSHHQHCKYRLCYRVCIFQMLKYMYAQIGLVIPDNITGCYYFHSNIKYMKNIIQKEFSMSQEDSRFVIDTLIAMKNLLKPQAQLEIHTNSVVIYRFFNQPKKWRRYTHNPYKWKTI